MSILSIKDLNIKIKNKDVITDGSLQIDAGDVLLLTGPNGSGKSTIIKTVMGDLFDYGSSIKVYATQLTFDDGTESCDLKGDEKNREAFRRHVCYISQDDDFESESVFDCFRMSLNYLPVDNPNAYIFDFVRRFSIYEGFGVDNHLDLKSKNIIKNAGIKKNSISSEDIKAAKYLSMNTRIMSGGQKKLTNIFANLVKCEFCRLILLDEPLNNLDYNNVRSFSNALTRIHNSYSDIGIVIVTHCRSIPIVNKVIEIDPNNGGFKIGKQYTCNSCFGEIDNSGLYV